MENMWKRFKLTDAEPTDVQGKVDGTLGLMHVFSYHKGGEGS